MLGVAHILLLYPNTKYRYFTDILSNKTVTYMVCYLIECLILNWSNNIV